VIRSVEMLEGGFQTVLLSGIVSWFMVRILTRGDVWREFVGDFHVRRPDAHK
jgi:hypothetical protein